MSRYTSESGWDATDELIAVSNQLKHADSLQETFEKYLVTREQAFPEVAYYAKHGEWRTEQTVAAADLDDPFSAKPHECYYNAQTSFGPDTQYVEGYAIHYTKQAAIPHAWLERDEVILELTPSLDHTVSTYYGVAFDHVDVTHALIEREHASPIVEAAVVGLFADADE
jgi:hypothetical protein